MNLEDLDTISTVDESLIGLKYDYEPLQWKIKSSNLNSNQTQQSDSPLLPYVVSAGEYPGEHVKVTSKLEKLKVASLPRRSPLPTTPAPTLSSQQQQQAEQPPTVNNTKLAPITNLNKAFSILGLSSPNTVTSDNDKTITLQQQLNAVATILQATMHAQQVQSHPLQCRLRTINLHINFHNSNLELCNKSLIKGEAAGGVKQRSSPSPWLSGAACAQSSKHRIVGSVNNANKSSTSTNNSRKRMVWPSKQESLDQLQKLEEIKREMLERLVFQCLKNKMALSRLHMQLVNACVTLQNKQLSTRIFKHWKAAAVVSKHAVTSATDLCLILKKKHASKAFAAWHAMAQYNGHLGQMYTLRCKYQRQQTLKALFSSWRYVVEEKKLAAITSSSGECWRRRTTLGLVFGRWRATALRLQHQKAALLRQGHAASPFNSTIKHIEKNGENDDDDATVPQCSIAPAAHMALVSNLLLDEKLKNNNRKQRNDDPTIIQHRKAMAASKALLQSFIPSIVLPVGLVPLCTMADVRSLLDNDDDGDDDDQEEGLAGSVDDDTTTTQGTYCALNYTSPVKKRAIEALGEDNSNDTDDGDAGINTLEDQLLDCYELLQQCERDCYSAEQESKELSMVSLRLQTELVEAEHGLDQATHALSAGQYAVDEALLNVQVAEEVVDKAVAVVKQANTALENAQQAYALAKEEAEQACLDVIAAENALEKSKNEVLQLRRVITEISKEMEKMTMASKQRPVADARLKDAAAAVDRHHKRIEKVMLQLDLGQKSVETAQEEVYNRAADVSIAQGRVINSAAHKMEAEQLLQQVERDLEAAQQGLGALEAEVKTRFTECQLLVGQLNAVKNQDRRAVALSIRLREKVTLLENMLTELHEKYEAALKQQLLKEEEEEESDDPLMVPTLQQQEKEVSEAAGCGGKNDGALLVVLDQELENNAAAELNIDEQDDDDSDDDDDDENTGESSIDTYLGEIALHISEQPADTGSHYSTPATSPRAVRAITAATSLSYSGHHGIMLSQLTSMDAAAIKSRTCILKRCVAAFRQQLQHAQHAEQHAHDMYALKVGLPVFGGWKCQTEADKGWIEESRHMLLLRLCLKSWVRVTRREQLLAALYEEEKRQLEVKSKQTAFAAWYGLVMKQKTLNEAMHIWLIAKKWRVLTAWRAHVVRSKMLKERVTEWQLCKENTLLFNSWTKWKQAVKTRRTLRNVFDFAISLRAREVGQGKEQAERETRAAVMHVWRVAVLMGQLERRRDLMLHTFKMEREKRVKRCAMEALRRHAKDPLMGLVMSPATAAGVSPVSLSHPPGHCGAALATASIKLDDENINWDANVSSWKRKAEVWRRKQK